VVYSLKIFFFIYSYFLYNDNEFKYYGDENQRVDFCTYEDTAKYVAAIVSHSNKFGEVFISSFNLSLKELVTSYNKIRTEHKPIILKN